MKEHIITCSPAYGIPAQRNICLRRCLPDCFRRIRRRFQRFRTAVGAGTVRIIDPDPITVTGIGLKSRHFMRCPRRAIDFIVKHQIITGRAFYGIPADRDRVFIRRYRRARRSLRCCPYLLLLAVITNAICIFRAHLIGIFRILPQTRKCSGRCRSTVGASVKLNIIAGRVAYGIPFYGHGSICRLTDNAERNIRHFCKRHD